ncbi:MAG: hypothetical protein ABW223_12575 [Rariglobus sp.]
MPLFSKTPPSSPNTFRAVVSFAAVSLLTVLSLRAASADSLLPDGTFEQLNAAGTWPKGWPTSKNVTWETEGSNHFLRLKSAEPGKQVSLYLDVPLTHGVQALELSFLGRVTGLERGEQNWFDARIILNFKDAAGKRLPVHRLPYFSKDTVDWVPTTLRFKVPETAVSLEIMPTLFKVTNGEFDLDNITLKPADPALVK